MRYFAIYLAYLAVLSRLLSWISDGRPSPPLIGALLAIYGAIMLANPWLSRRWRHFPRLYVLLQSALVIAMYFTAPAMDFISILQIPLSYEAVKAFGVRVGFLWIGLYSLAMTGMLFAGLEFGPGIVMLVLGTGINILMGSFAHLNDRTERARLENLRMFAELNSAYHTLKDEAAQAETLAAAEERSRLVRELHDSLTQTLFSMNLAVQAARLTAGQDLSQTRGHLVRLQSLAQSAAGEVQALTGQASRSAPLAGGLPAALQRLAAERYAQDGLQIALEVTGPQGSSPLPEKVTANLFHIAQEALNNIAKHAGTSQAVVRLDLGGPDLGRPACLEIQDHGCGFDTCAGGRPGGRAGGLGLDEMAGRAKEIGWQIEVESAPGQGTCIRVREKTG